jgi:hypothetical protein
MTTETARAALLRETPRGLFKDLTLDGTNNIAEVTRVRIDLNSLTRTIYGNIDDRSAIRSWEVEWDNLASGLQRICSSTNLGPDRPGMPLEVEIAASALLSEMYKFSNDVTKHTYDLRHACRVFIATNGKGIEEEPRA